MTVHLPARKSSLRKVRAHTKSRSGCGNCKLRGVKCDEGKPQCSKCLAYGVVCDYEGNNDSELQLRGEATSIILPHNLCYWPSTEQEVLSKFQGRTAYTVSAGDRLHIYQNEVVHLASKHTFLMDAITALVLMHDRYILTPVTSRPAVAEAQYWYQATSAFSRRLTRPIDAAEQTSLLTTAALLGNMTFGNIAATSAAEAWPLAPPSLTDLDWLTMSDGKKEVWKLTQPAEPGPLFKRLAAVYTQGIITRTVSADLMALPPDCIELYELNGDSNAANNPYYTAAKDLAQILHHNDPIILILTFLCFISTMHHTLKQLLRDKEPRALLLLASWYAKLCPLPVWWLHRRAQLEGQAICIYLERYHKDDTRIHDFLQIPKDVLFSTHISTFL